ncbi:MAG TPA: Nramp family divalent metal transporter [Planctomycetota bacterium]|nr:Nramp family divalent metal transporter [Planctomycetota bacterium]
MADFLAPLDDLKPKDLPDNHTPFWKMIGPGAVMVGLAIGAGEIVIWPYITAKYGPGMVWAAVVGVMLQVWVNFEVGRWTICTGETVFTGYARVWRGFAPLFIVFTILGWLAPGWARASGLASKALLVGPQGWGSDTFWTCCTFSVVALMLFGPKVAYKVVEKSITAMVILVTLGMITVAVAVGTTDAWKQLFGGIMNIGYRDPSMSVKELFSALVFAGAGGTSNLFYSFYLRDKHIGMGAHVPTMTNPLRGEPEKIPATGYVFPDTPENQGRFQRWWRYVRTDTLCIFWFLNTLTILLFIFGAIAVLRPQNIELKQGTLIWDEAVVLGQIWGQPGRILFLMVGIATLFSTQLALVDGVSRTIADIVYTNFKPAQTKSVSWWYTVVAIGWILTGCVITAVMEQFKIKELSFLFNAAYMGGFAMAVYVPLQLYLNHTYLPPSARPGITCTVMTSIAGLVYIAFALASIAWELGLLKA